LGPVSLIRRIREIQRKARGEEVRENQKASGETVPTEGFGFEV
jgi:hypothetical protein